MHPGRRRDTGSLTRWNPLEEMERMRQEMDRFIGEFGMRGSGLPQLAAGAAMMPNVEVYQTDKEVVVKAEVPGMEPGDVNIEVTEDAVHLTGELKKEEEIKEDNYYRSERQYGNFERVIPLPDRIKDDQAKATFKNGVITIRAPLAEEPKKPQARKLRIES